MNEQEAYFTHDQVALYLGDCIEVMAAMDEASVDAVVCDPPYGLEFMGKEWDRPWAVSPTSSTGYEGRDDLTLPSHRESRNANCRGCGGRQRGSKRCRCASPQWDIPPVTQMLAFQQWSQEWCAEAFRVLKPGGHLLAFGGTRTFHRLACAVEDAGFEVRDCLSWLYGSGFPKSLDVSKAIDKKAGAEREVMRVATRNGNAERRGEGEQGATYGDAHGGFRDLSAPATDAAREWEGWGTALKPAWEPVVVARKPLIGTVAENVTTHGTGALNIDGCRIDSPKGDGVWGTSNASTTPTFNGSPDHADYRSQQHAAGRWPANVALDEAAAAMLDAQSGERGAAAPASGPTWAGPSTSQSRASFNGMGDRKPSFHSDSGGASRFFYCAKASKKDRGPGNTHPTVKPTALMRWLVRLVTPPGGVVLDPFAGSGTTLLAAREEGFRAVGIEREEEYAKIIVARLGGQMTIPGTEGAR